MINKKQYEKKYSDSFYNKGVYEDIDYVKYEIDLDKKRLEIICEKCLEKAKQAPGIDIAAYATNIRMIQKKT